MATRREISKFSSKRRESTELFTDELVTNKPNLHPTSTPIRVNNRSEDEDSPYFPCSTQELREDVDVLWDYNSPQSKPRTSIIRKSKKRLDLQQSPKVPFRRHPSNNNEQIKQDFCKLREELKALRAEIAKPDHEESLILSPREEEVFKTQGRAVDLEPPNFNYCDFDDDDPFDDDMDDKLIMFSQQVESKLVNKAPDCSNTIKSLINNCDTKVTTKTGTKLQDSEVFDDSFDKVLSQMDEDELDQLTQVVDIRQYKNQNDVAYNDKNSKVFPRSQSEDNVKITRSSGNRSKTVTGKVEWHRTQSFESYSSTQLSKETLQEIERKRLEAKAKLEAKKRNNPIITTIPEVTNSPLKCSPDEIEKKRLQALAKLEAKRQRDIIERNKQEALRRREENRKRNVAQVKSSLTKRL